MKSHHPDISWVNGSDGTILALVVRARFAPTGVEFLTPSTANQQIAYMSRIAGDVIQPHIHERVERTTIGTQEVLYIRRGKIRVDFFETNQDYVCSYTLESGDLMLLSSGGHGFEIIDDVDMIEIKQGPFVEGKDKSRFKPEPFEVRCLDGS